MNRGDEHCLVMVTYIFTLGTVIGKSRVWLLALLDATVMSLFVDLFNDALSIT
jgi:uncharacterized membrane protein YczE